jgi:hypothetical protein
MEKGNSSSPAVAAGCIELVGDTIFLSAPALTMGADHHFAPDEYAITGFVPAKSKIRITITICYKRHYDHAAFTPTGPNKIVTCENGNGLLLLN